MLEWRSLFLSRIKLSDLPNIFRFLNWISLIRTIAWLFTFIRRSKRRNRQFDVGIKCRKLGRVELVWGKFVQHKCLGNGISNL